jgi:hypothetical protein
MPATFSQASGVGPGEVQKQYTVSPVGWGHCLEFLWFLSACCVESAVRCLGKAWLGAQLFIEIGG